MSGVRVLMIMSDNNGIISRLKAMKSVYNMNVILKVYIILVKQGNSEQC